MPEIKSFEGLVYNSNKAKGYSRVVSPPYDVIPKDLQDKLYNLSPYNVVRLILGKIKPSDDTKDNRYTRAAGFLNTWLKEKVIARDKKDSIYLYSQAYKYGSKILNRLGFIALMKIDTKNKDAVHPHENTLLAPKIDRLNLIRATRANLEPIFVLYEDNPHTILNVLKKYSLANRPLIDIASEGVRHRLWRLDDKKAVRKIAGLMKSKETFIADGHHRYEVSVTYATEAADKNAQYIMAYFVELNENFLTVLPTHRLIKDIGMLKKEDILKRLSKFFVVKKVAGMKAVMSGIEKLKNRCAFGMYLGKNDFYIIKLRSTRHSDAIIKSNSKDWKRLDVTILHLFLLEYVLGIRDDEDNIEFVKDAPKAKAMVDSRKHRIAFFLNPTKVKQVKRIAKLGEKMPRKATYFYPKQLSGLVINRMN